MPKENLDLMQTRNMLGMQVLQSNPNKVFHQSNDRHLVMQLVKVSTLVHTNKLIFRLLLQFFSTPL